MATAALPELAGVLSQHVTLLGDGFHVPDVDAPSWTGVLASLSSTEFTAEEVERVCRELECIDVTQLNPMLFLGDNSAYASHHAIALLGVSAVILVAQGEANWRRVRFEEAGVEYLVISQERGELLADHMADQLDACRKLFARRAPLLVCSENGRGLAAAICAALLAEPYSPSDVEAAEYAEVVIDAAEARADDEPGDTSAVSELADTAAAAIRAVEIKRGDCFVELDEQLELAKHILRRAPRPSPTFKPLEPCALRVASAPPAKGEPNAADDASPLRRDLLAIHPSVHDKGDQHAALATLLSTVPDLAAAAAASDCAYTTPTLAPADGKPRVPPLALAGDFEPSEAPLTPIAKSASARPLKLPAQKKRRTSTDLPCPPGFVDPFADLPPPMQKRNKANTSKAYTFY